MLAYRLAGSRTVVELNLMNAEQWLNVSLIMSLARGDQALQRRAAHVWARLCNTGAAATAKGDWEIAFDKLGQALKVTDRLVVDDAQGRRSPILRGLTLERLAYSHHVAGNAATAEVLKRKAERILGRACAWPPEPVSYEGGPR